MRAVCIDMCTDACGRSRWRFRSAWCRASDIVGREGWNVNPWYPCLWFCSRRWFVRGRAWCRSPRHSRRAHWWASLGSIGRSPPSGDSERSLLVSIRSPLGLLAGGERLRSLWDAAFRRSRRPRSGSFRSWSVLGRPPMRPSLKQFPQRGFLPRYLLRNRRWHSPHCLVGRAVFRRR